MILWALLRCWWHCLLGTFTGHQMVAHYRLPFYRYNLIACTCGKEFYRRPGYDENDVQEPRVLSADEMNELVDKLYTAPIPTEESIREHLLKVKGVRKIRFKEQAVGSVQMYVHIKWWYYLWPWAAHKVMNIIATQVRNIVPFNVKTDIKYRC